MNVLICGQQATGKSTTAEALKKFYESKGGSCELLEDEPFNTRAEMMAKRSIAFKRIKSTKGDSNFHTIVVVQIPDRETPTPESFDYIIRCTGGG